MQYHHRRYAGRPQAIELVAIAFQFHGIEGRPWTGLQTRPLDTQAIGFYPELLHQRNILTVPMIMIARAMTVASIGCDKICPLVHDVPLDLCRRSSRAP